MDPGAQAGETLQIERSARGLLRLSLSRPERGNALNPIMIRELSEQIEAACDDPSVRLIVLRGVGKHFCGGADIAGAGSRTPGLRLPDLLLRWDRAPKPTVAFVQGACIGAGLALASCCDVVVAAPDAFFSIPEVRLGMIPGLLPFFVRAVGGRAFRRYGLSGERFSSEAALRCEFVSEIAAVESWPKAELEILNAFLEAGPQALAAIKAATQRFSTAPLGPELFPDSASHESPESLEGKAAFKEKRKPNWWIDPAG